MELNKTFNDGLWSKEINVTDFVRRNITPYEGDASFLEGATPRTRRIWELCLAALEEERRNNGIRSLDNKTVSTITSHKAGYIDRENELIVGLQTDELLKRAIKPFGGINVVSRACREFVEKLFEREVAEIHDGVVKIMGIAREPGKRTKVAVMSTDPRVDPVGACVGMRGQRVRNITDELGNERVDIVPYDEDIRKYAVNALLPAKVQSVEVDEEKHELIVRVTEEQSKLAFGKKAQNVRLCSKLIGWNISIRNEDDGAEPKNNSIAEQLRAAARNLAAELKVSEKTARLLVNNGYVTVDDFKAADLDSLLDIEGIDQDEVNVARNLLDD